MKMKTITWKEAVATMNGMAFILARVSKELGIKIEEIEGTTRAAFELYCELEHIAEVEEE